MNEMMMEKFTQELVTMIEQSMTMYIMVQKLPPSGEMMNQLNARLDAMQSSLAHMEKKLGKDNESIVTLKANIEHIKATTDAIQVEQVSQIKRSNELLNVLDYNVKTQHQFTKKQLEEVKDALSEIYGLLFFGRATMVIIAIVLIVLCIKSFS